MTASDPKITAMAATAALMLAVWCARRRLFDLTCTAAFFCSYLVFVALGVLASPWLIEGYLQQSFSSLRWGLLTPRDLNVAIVTLTAGLLLFLAGNYAMDWLYRRPSGQWLAFLRPPAAPMRLGMSPHHLLAAYAGFAVVALAFLATRLPAIVHGFSQVYLKFDHTAYYEVREKVQELGLPYYLIIYNAFPFCAQALFLLDRLSHLRGRRLAAFLWLVPPLLFLLFTFEKTSLILFVLLSGFTLLLAKLYSQRLILRTPARFSSGQLVRILYRVKGPLWLSVAAAFLVLMLIYTLTTDSIIHGQSPLGMAGRSMVVVLDRICLRLAVMPLMYCHYFPQIEPFYGLANVGKLAFLTGSEYFSDTVRVLHHFTGLEKGGGAIGSLTDFYCAFGWPGLAGGSFLLGATLRGADGLLRGMAPTVLNRVLWLYLLSVSWYLSQASVFRCLSSYGGGVFLGLWFVFSLSRRPAAAQHPSSPGLV